MKTVVIGMSGGVDSSVAALLLKKEGYNLIGVFMKNWEEQDENGVCASDIDAADAKEICNKLNIPFYAVNYAKEYKEKVFSEFLEDIKNGLTPNPDVLCNREIKFGPLLKYAESLGADYIATGHYAKVEKQNGVYQLKKCADENKDQTYFLNQLNQYQLSKIMFPLAEIKKPQVRSLAKEYNLTTANKKDSTGICFIGERNFKNFLSNYFAAKPGKIVTEDGKVIGTHDGLCFYTLGQSKGLGLGGVKGYEGIKWCILKKDLKNNTLIVGSEKSPLINSRALKASVFNFTGEVLQGKTISCTAKFRYRQADQKVKATFDGDGVYVEFNEKQRAVTPGQYVVLYDGENCIGGGKIDEVIF